MKTRITELFAIQYPIIQGGMVWVSGHKLASAVSNAGGLGLIGAGSMKADLLREHIRKALTETEKPIGVNIPLLRSDVEDLITAAIEEGVRIVFTSAGHPGKHIERLKDAGCTVAHVVSSVKQALKVESVGCDAVVAEGFEAGGHNGVDEISTMCLVPQVVDAVSIPVIAAGGIADGRGMLAAMCLGAEGIQVGTRFAATTESSAHENYKRLVIETDDSGTILTLKKAAPVRLIKTPFAGKAFEAEKAGATKEMEFELMGKKRERLGIFEGDLEEGMFEAGQCSGLIRDLPTAGEVVRRIVNEYAQALQKNPEI